MCATSSQGRARSRGGSSSASSGAWTSTGRSRRRSACRPPAPRPRPADARKRDPAPKAERRKGRWRGASPVWDAKGALVLRPAGSTPTLRARTRAWCAVLPLACASAAAAGDLAPPLAEVDLRIGQIEAALAAAHFRSALGLTRGAAALLDPLGPSADGVAPRRARIELLTATAEV